MEKISLVLISLVAIEHFYIMYIQMVLWTTPKGLKAFGMNQKTADASADLAKNQGLYNSFLAVALVIGLFHPTPEVSSMFKYFGLACVIVAALYGAATVSKRILIVQGLPAFLALGALLIFG